jgi:hypothetical protein
MFTAVIMERTVCWDDTLCSPVEFRGRFGEIFCLNLQGKL